MSKKLLLADDSITIQKVIQITFAHEDYELTITDNGDAALAKAQELKPDLVMTDIYMPGKNGYELTSAIKQDPALGHIPVLLLAGSFEPFDEDKAKSCKADAWIEKPFESQNLIDKVAELLSAEQTASSVEQEATVSEPPVATVEELPEAAFDEPVNAAPEAATSSDDPFGDISFEEEVTTPQPEPIVAADDWSDVALEPVVEEPAVEEPVVEEPAVEEPVAEEPAVEESFAIAEEPLEAVAEDFDFVEEAPVDEVSTDFSFAEEEPMPDALPTVEETPVAEADFDVFGMADDEIMPLDDDDILGAEDLEPAMPEQTLAAWSRDAADDDVFTEALEETAAVEDEDIFAVEEPAAESTVFEEVAVDTSAAFEEPVESLTPASESVSFTEEPEPAAIEPEPAAIEPESATVAATMAGVEAKASALSEEELELIIEKVVTKVVEKLASSILERVAWDVVPDLAENMIREEIRKIKDAAA